jgi:hypothetical protein
LVSRILDQRMLEARWAGGEDAEAKTRAFLAAHLGGTSPGEPTAK